MQGVEELPTLHSRELLHVLRGYCVPGVASPSTPQPHLKDLAGHLSKPESTGNSCSPSPAADLLSKMPLCRCRKETQFLAKRQGWASFLVNMPDESQPWESSSGDHLPHLGCTHMWAQTFAGAPPNTLDGPPPSRGRVRRE